MDMVMMMRTRGITTRQPSGRRVAPVVHIARLSGSLATRRVVAADAKFFSVASAFLRTAHTSCFVEAHGENHIRLSHRTAPGLGREPRVWLSRGRHQRDHGGAGAGGGGHRLRAGAA